MEGGRIVVVGASMGGVHALQRFVADLPANFAAPLLLVLHIGHHRSLLPDLLKWKGVHKPIHAFHGAQLHPGQILIAPPDRHMLVEGGRIRLSGGPKEHFSRPAIDPLFRSAALEYGAGAIGVILTGRLDDGTAGLQAIKAAGGIAIVQDPNDALEPSMPQSALRYVRVDHTVPIARMAETCQLVLAQPVAETRTPQPAVQEHCIATQVGNPMKLLTEIGAPSTFVCPDCHGSLWELRNVEPPRFRCHTGHAYTLRTLQHAQSLATDEALANGLRALQEQKFLIEKAMESESSKEASEQWRAAVLHTEKDVATLRALIEQHLSVEEP